MAKRERFRRPELYKRWMESRKSWVRGGGQPSVSRFNLTGVRQGEAESLGRFGVGMVERSVRNGATTGARSILTSQSVPRRRGEGMECLDPVSEGCRAVCCSCRLDNIVSARERLSSCLHGLLPRRRTRSTLTIRESGLMVRVYRNLILPFPRRETLILGRTERPQRWREGRLDIINARINDGATSCWIVMTRFQGNCIGCDCGAFDARGLAASGSRRRCAASIAPEDERKTDW